LKSGDIINIDITVFLNGYHGDTSCTVLVGDVDQRGIGLVNDTKYALDLGISVVKPGSNFNEIGNIIQKYANSKRYSIDRNFCGHGIGANFHQAPLILHYANDQSGVFQPGMVFTIEPILVQGCEGYVKWPDQWTVVSRDGSRSAQFEHTVLVTDNGHEILTQ
jgi:methionyl aminopeptidase